MPENIISEEKKTESAKASENSPLSRARPERSAAESNEGDATTSGVKEGSETTLILYYCKECKEIVEGKSSSAKKKYTFKCPTCKEICSYGSETGIISHFKIKESSENYQKIQKIKETRAQKKSEK